VRDKRTDFSQLYIVWDLVSLLDPLVYKRRISIKTKRHRYRPLFVPVFVYCAESWAITFKVRRSLDVFDIRHQHSLLRVSWQQHITNDSIGDRPGQPTASSFLCQRCIVTLIWAPPTIDLQHPNIVPTAGLRR